MAKILLHTLLFPPDANSNAYIFADLAVELKNLGHEIVVLTTTPHYAIDREAIKSQPMVPARCHWLRKSEYRGIHCFHVTVPPVKGGFKKRISTAVRFHVLALLAMLSRELSFDIVISQSPPLTIGLVSAAVARWRGAKSVFVAQDIFPDGLILQGKIRHPIFVRLLRLLEQIVYRSNDAVCSISEGLVEVLRTRVPRTTILRMIPNFVNTGLYHPLPRVNTFTKQHYLESDFVVSYVGNLGNAQDFAPVLEAADSCRDIPVKFLLVGTGIKEKWIAEQIYSRELPNIVLLGYQPRELTPLINASSDICLTLLSPHVLNFSFPSKIYTIMACGRPTLIYGQLKADAAQFIVRESVGWAVQLVTLGVLSRE